MSSKGIEEQSPPPLRSFPHIASGQQTNFLRKNIYVKLG